MWRFIWDLWFKLPRIIRFIFVGGFNAVLAYTVFCLLVYFAGDEWRQLCLIIQWILTSFFSYFLYRIFVFESQGKIWQEYIKSCATWIVGYFVNAIALEIFFQLALNIYLAQLIAQIIAAIVTYFSFRYWALRNK